MLIDLSSRLYTKIEAEKEKFPEMNQGSIYNKRRKNNSERDAWYFIMEIMRRKAEHNTEKKYV